MPFNAGEYVHSRSQGWYGQVVRQVESGMYRVRIGGTDSTRDLPEADLELQMGRSIAPRVFPPVRTLSTSITAPAFAYPFSNEKGFERGAPLWQSLGVVEPGAVVGVSGSILDLAAAAGDNCRQVVSTDINSCTTQYVDQLRRILVLLGEVGQIIKIKRNWRTGLETSRQVISLVDFFKNVIEYIRNYNLKVQEFVNSCDFQNQGPAQSLKAELAGLETSMKQTVTQYFSNWFDVEANFWRLAELVKQGNFFLLCGDLSRVETLAALRDALGYPITIFNISNALDYIPAEQIDPLIDMFVRFPHTGGAKVVSSSQSLVSRCTDLLGTFAVPKVHTWAEFIEVLKELKASALCGGLSSVK